MENEWWRSGVASLARGRQNLVVLGAEVIGTLHQFLGRESSALRTGQHLAQLRRRLRTQFEDLRQVLF